MTTVTEADIKELKEFINNRFDGLSQEIKEVKQDVKELDKRLTVIEATLQAQQLLIQKIPDLAEKVGELKNWKQASLVVITAFVTSIFTGTIGGVIGWLIRGGRS